MAKRMIEKNEEHKLHQNELFKIEDFHKPHD
jgi:hypothetical protein